MKLLDKIKKWLKDKTINRVVIIVICVIFEILVLSSDNLHEFAKHPVVQIAKIVRSLFNEENTK